MLYQAELLPEVNNNGAPERTRTSNRLIRSQVLYPIELRALIIVLVYTCYNNGTENRNRTGTVVTYRRILSPVRLPVPPPRLGSASVQKNGAEDEVRTRDLHLGKVAFYH